MPVDERAEMGPDTTIITRIATTTAATIIGRCWAEAHRREHRVQREHDVDDGDLHHDRHDEAGE